MGSSFVTGPGGVRWSVCALARKGMEREREGSGGRIRTWLGDTAAAEVFDAAGAARGLAFDEDGDDGVDEGPGHLDAEVALDADDTVAWVVASGTLHPMTSLRSLSIDSTNTFLPLSLTPSSIRKNSTQQRTTERKIPNVPAAMRNGVAIEAAAPLSAGAK